MINDIIRNLFRFILLITVQVLVLNNFQVNGYLNPFLYILFILLLPFETPPGLLMLLGLATGITIDMFMDTMGLHSAACVFLAFMRPRILKLISPREGYEFGVQPTLQHLGPKWYFSYAGFSVLLHHLVLFYLEIFRFDEFWRTMLRVILSSVFTFTLIIITQFLLYRSRNKA
jgi:hypothetical protein